MENKVTTFEIEDGIAILTINRPDKMNALNKDVFTEIEAAVDELQNNAQAKSMIITGSGPKAFVAGADIAEFSSYSAGQAKALSKRGQDIFFKIENSKKPVVAAVNGFCLGGGNELAMACHFRLASENAKFGQPEVNLGLIPGYGGTQRLTQLVGKAKSFELNMSGAMIDAQEALRLGLVNYVTTIEELLPKTKEILSLINSKAPVAVAKIIECVNVSVNNNLADETGFDFEVNAFGECFETADMKEGVNAFLEKRKTNFTGK